MIGIVVLLLANGVSVAQLFKSWCGTPKKFSVAHSAQPPLMIAATKLYSWRIERHPPLTESWAGYLGRSIQVPQNKYTFYVNTDVLNFHASNTLALILMKTPDIVFKYYFIIPLYRLQENYWQFFVLFNIETCKYRLKKWYLDKRIKKIVFFWTSKLHKSLVTYFEFHLGNNGWNVS